jgi:hypothetical protein
MIKKAGAIVVVRKIVLFYGSLPCIDFRQVALMLLLRLQPLMPGDEAVEACQKDNYANHTRESVYPIPEEYHRRNTPQKDQKANDGKTVVTLAEGFGS